MYFDKDILDKIISNLLSNAIKFTHIGGKIDLLFELISENDHTHVCIRVKDNGEGIAEESIDKIFDRFYQNSDKGGFGIGLAFIQGVLFMAIVGGLNQQPLIIVLALLLGAIMTTAIGFVIGSLARDFMSVLAWGMIFFIILVIPAFGVMFPGAVTSWIKFIPSYYLVEMVHKVSGFGAGWGDIWLNIVILLAFSLVFFWIGILGIRRKAL